jgi:hypothetical protein
MPRRTGLPRATKILDDERRYLEGLLLSRFNFYLVFVALFLVAIFNPNLPGGAYKTHALIVGTVISFLMALAVTRTAALVGRALDEIGKPGKHPEHPFPLLSVPDPASPARLADLALRLPKAYSYHVLVTWFVTIYCLFLIGLPPAGLVSIVAGVFVALIGWLCLSERARRRRMRRLNGQKDDR